MMSLEQYVCILPFFLKTRLFSLYLPVLIYTGSCALNVTTKILKMRQNVLNTFRQAS